MEFKHPILASSDSLQKAASAGGHGHEMFWEPRRNIMSEGNECETRYQRPESVGKTQTPRGGNAAVVSNTANTLFSNADSPRRSKASGVPPKSRS